MGYSTGTFSGSDDLEDVHTLLLNFLTAEGWTIGTSTYPALVANIGQCFVNLAFTTVATLNDIQGSTANAVSPDHRIEGRLGVNATAVSVSGESRVVSNDWLGPYAKYWLFGPASGEPKYVHLVVQKANGRFSHISFGEIDKKGATYTGGAFLHGTFWRWDFRDTSYSQFNTSGEGSDAGGGAHRTLGDTTDDFNQSTYNVFVGALDATYPVIANNGFFNGSKLIPVMARQSKGMAQMEDTTARWLGWVAHVGPNPINGVTPLFEFPFLWQNVANQRSRYLGGEPGRRMCSMIGRLEAETISFGADDYIVFPLKKSLPYDPEFIPWTNKTPTSGPYGHAFKVND